MKKILIWIFAIALCCAPRFASAQEQTAVDKDAKKRAAYGPNEAEIKARLDAEKARKDAAKAKAHAQDKIRREQIKKDMENRKKDVKKKIKEQQRDIRDTTKK